MIRGTRPTRPPGWVVAVAGAVFIIFGLAALAAGARGLYRRRRARRAYLAGAGPLKEHEPTPSLSP